MASSSIQFKGIEGVVTAYENRNVPAWSLWQGKQFMFKYEGPDLEQGAEQLEKTLEMLSESSNAIYTLKVYEDVPGGKIKSNTPDDGSFNFKINADTQLVTQNQYASLKHNNAIAERLAAIEERLNEREEENDEPEENRLGMIGTILEHPALQPIITQVLANIFTTKKSDAAAPPQTASVVPMQPVQRAAINGVHDDAKILQAINDLKAHDERLADHLAKLASIAKNDPGSFNFLIATLDNLKV